MRICSFPGFVCLFIVTYATEVLLSLLLQIWTPQGAAILVRLLQTNSRKGLPWFAFYKQTEKAWPGLLFTTNQPTKKQKRLGLIHSLQTNKPTKNRKGLAWFTLYKQTNKKQKRLGLVCSLQTNSRKCLAWFTLYKQTNNNNKKCVAWFTLYKQTNNNNKIKYAWLGSLFTNK